MGKLVFFVNSKKVEIIDPPTDSFLLHFLRNKLYLTGTKNACNQGGCGACSVILSRYDRKSNKIRHVTANSCITPLCNVHGYAVTTIEGIGTSRDGLHPIQESLVKSHGIQCGFCTPGMVISLCCLLRNNPRPSQDDVEKALEGNLCRCTGYRPIIDSMKPFVECPLGEKCCKNTPPFAESSTNAYSSSTYKPTDVTQDAVFPPELMRWNEEESVSFGDNECRWITPRNLKQLKQSLKDNPDSYLIAGATSLSMRLKEKTLATKSLISCMNVEELNTLTFDENGLIIGAAVTISRLQDFLLEMSSKWGEENQTIKAIQECTRWIAADQIRNVATVGGHIVCGDPRSDLNPVLMALEATVAVMNKTDGLRQQKIDKSFFVREWKTCLKPGDVIVTISIPPIERCRYMKYYKQPQRRGFSYAIVNAVFVSDVTSDGHVTHFIACYGGLADTTLQLDLTKEFSGLTWDGISVDKVASVLKDKLDGLSFQIDSVKVSLAFGFMRKWKTWITSKLGKMKDMEVEMSLDICRSSIIYEEVPETQEKIDPVWRPIPAITATDLVSGQAKFIDDIPPYQNELHVGLVLSTKARASILNVDISGLVDSPGFVDYLDHTSVPGNNRWGIFAQDEELFASKEVHYYGQKIGAVLCETREQAMYAASQVRVEYEEKTPILTIEDAINTKSFYEYVNNLKERGDIEKGFAESSHILEGAIKTGAQEHLYMEPMAAIVIPKNEQNEFEVLVTHQNPKFHQRTVSSILGIPNNRVIIRHRRTGGAFGGKETQPIHALGPASVGAYRTGRPVRCVLSRKQDFVLTGKRHPYLFKYKVGISKEGKILCLDIRSYADAGHSLDMSPAVLDFTIILADGTYNIPHIRSEGFLCRTNTTSKTAFRGFGSPQTYIAKENIITQISHFLDIPMDQIQEINLYKEGDIPLNITPFQDSMLRRCWDDCKKQAFFVEKQREVKEFNITLFRCPGLSFASQDIVVTNSQWRKMGIAMMPVNYPIGYPDSFLNQGYALINIYLDGSVSLSHGGCEIGQGINTKMIQVASRALEIPMDKIYTSENSTLTIANAGATSASTGTDLNGAAVLNGCNILMERLKPLSEKTPGISWEELVKKAYFSRINLSAFGYARPQRDKDQCNYYTYGAACCVVEIDCLTGEHKIVSTDIVMDVGKSLNPGIDVGQIEGAFVQGYGMVALEEVILNKDGHMKTIGPVDYKIPGVRNVPRNFRVTLLKECPNTKAVYSSKGIGEPPLVLAVSVYSSIKEAIHAARKQLGMNGPIQIDCPLTPRDIQRACQEEATQLGR